MEIIELSMVLWRRRAVIAVSLVLFLGVAILGTALLPRSWEATTEVLVAGQDSAASLLADIGLDEMATALTNSEDIQNKIYLATSAPVIEEVIWRLQLRDGDGYLFEPDDITGGGPISSLKGAPRVQVSQVPGTDVLLLEVAAPTPEAARLMADTLAEVTIEHTTEQAHTETQEAQRFVQEQLQVVTSELDTALARIAEAQRDSQIIDLDSEVHAAVSRLSDLLLEQEQVAAAIQETRARIRSAEQFRGQESATAVSATSMTENPVIGGLRTRLTDLRAEREALLADHHTERSPEVQRLDSQIAAMEAELGDAISEMTELDPVVASLQADLDGLQERATEIGASIQRTTEAFASYPDKMRRLSQLELAATAAESVYRSLQDQSFQIGIAEAMSMSDIRVVAPARTPERPASPKALLNLLAGLVAGLAFGVASAFVLDNVDDTVKNVDDLREVGGIPLLGYVPRYRPGPVPALAALAPTDPLVEAHRTIRNNITYASLDTPVRTLAVTSAAPGEGKSTTAVNLALSLSQDGKRVLLVDADLRLATQHRWFPHLVPAPGLVEVVTHGAAAADAIQTIPSTTLSVLTAGDLPQNPAHIIESLRMRQVLLELGRDFDLIVLDTPPVLAVGDALVLSRLSDGVVVVVEAHQTTRRMLTEVQTRLDAAQITPLGVILNKSSAGTRSYREYAKHYHRKRGSSGRKAKPGGGAA